MTNPQTSTRRNFVLNYRLAVTALAFLALLVTAREARAQTSTLSDGLISHWHLDEASGARADSKGTNHLADNNTVTQVAGKLGQAAKFTRANNEYLSLPHNAGLATANAGLTVAVWVYLGQLHT